MNQTKTVLTAVAEFLFGRKYYANVILTRGTTRKEICSYIFRTKKEAADHRLRLATTESYEWMETISFRSRKDY